MVAAVLHLIVFLPGDNLLFRLSSWLVACCFWLDRLPPCLMKCLPLGIELHHHRPHIGRLAADGVHLHDQIVFN